MVKEWSKKSEKRVYDGYRKVLRRIFVTPEDREVDFDIKEEGPSVTILALTPENNVLIARQYRQGPEEILDELPGGAVDSGETPEEAAARELTEETGYTGELSYVGPHLLSAYSTGVRHNFVATNCRKVAEQKCDEHEFIETHEMPLADFRKHLRSGKLTGVATGYLCLEYLDKL